VIEPLTFLVDRHIHAAIIPLAKIFSDAPAGSDPIFSNNSSNGSPDQKALSNTDASLRASLYIRCLRMMIAQDQNDMAINIIMTSLTVSVARAKRASSEKSISRAAARVSVSMTPALVIGPFLDLA
jgi:hypothetical protein